MFIFLVVWKLTLLTFDELLRQSWCVSMAAWARRSVLGSLTLAQLLPDPSVRALQASRPRGAHPQQPSLLFTLLLLFFFYKLTFSFSWSIVGLQCCISFWCTAKQFSFIHISRRRKWYPLRENPVDRGAWQAAVHGVTKSWTQLSTPLCYMLGFMSHQFFFRLFPIIGYYKILNIVPCAIQ